MSTKNMKNKFDYLSLKVSVLTYLSCITDLYKQINVYVIVSLIPKSKCLGAQLSWNISWESGVYQMSIAKQASVLLISISKFYLSSFDRASKSKFLGEYLKYFCHMSDVNPQIQSILKFHVKCQQQYSYSTTPWHTN